MSVDEARRSEPQKEDFYIKWENNGLKAATTK